MPFIALIGRLLLAAIFLYSGYGKLGNAEGVQQYIASVGMPRPDIAYWAAVAIEIGGGVLLVVGLLARYAAAAMAIFCLVAAYYFHSNWGGDNGQIQMAQFMKNVAIAGGMMQVVAFGAGALSFDRD
jgi:putative oxidoreductase